MNAASIFFDFLDRRGLTPERMTDTVRSWNLTDMEAFIFDFNDYLPRLDGHRLSGVFDFQATYEMSGGSWPCAEVTCRIRKADQLARFAALYADRVIVQSPVPRRPPRHFNSWVKQQVVEDLRLIYHFEPLLRADLMFFAPELPGLCTDCLNRALGLETSLESTTRDIIRPYLDNVVTEIEQDPDHPGFVRIRQSGPEKLFEHKERIELRKGTVVDQTGYSIEDDVVDYLQPVIRDIVSQHFTTLLNGGNFLANRELHSDLIHALNQTPSQISRSSFLVDPLAHQLPYVSGVDLAKLVHLRRSEGESFELYRQAVSTALKAVPHIEDRHMGELFDDQIRPELAKIDLTLKNARKFLYGSIALDVVTLAGFLSLGLLSGLLPYDLEKVASAIGGFKCLTDLKSKVDQLRRESINLSQNKFYFLWKVKTLAGGS